MGAPNEDQIQKLVAQGVGQSQSNSDTDRRSPTWPFPTEGSQQNSDSGSAPGTGIDEKADGVQEQAVSETQSESTLGVNPTVVPITMLDGEADMACEGPTSCFHQSHCEIEQRAAQLTEKEVEEASKLLCEKLKLNPTEAHALQNLEIVQEVVRNFAFTSSIIREVAGKSKANCKNIVSSSGPATA